MKATTYGSALTASAQRLVEHLQNSQAKAVLCDYQIGSLFGVTIFHKQGKSVEEIMKISGLSKEQAVTVSRITRDGLKSQAKLVHSEWFWWLGRFLR